jgi:hypothetical protein
MSFDAALVREQGVTFAVVVVKPHVVNSDASRRQALVGFSGKFPGVPIVLMAQDGRGRPTYWGRPDIVGFLAGVPFDALPWKRWS